MIFGLSREPGFSDCIIGTRKWQDVVRRTTDFLLSDLGAEKILSFPGIENLNLMTSGPMVANPMDLLSSAEFSRLIKEFSANYDLVVLDCPPILMFADAMITGTHTDGTIIVYQVGRMARYALKRAKDQLINVKVPVQGVILNNVRTSEISTDYGYGYNYSYKYYSKENEASR
jgi:capsular exopolysaccharide synthesis family protein